MNKIKLAKKRKRIKRINKRRNILKIQRRKIRREGVKMEFKSGRGYKVFCNECRYTRKRKLVTGKKIYYCEKYDVKEEGDYDLIPRKDGKFIPAGMGKFKGNKTGDCISFKKRLFKIK